MSSLRKLAEDLDLSHATVSAALRGLPGVKPTTRERVLRAAESKGYRLNPLTTAIMGNLRRSRSGVFRGVIAIIRLQAPSTLSPETARAHERAITGIRGAANELGFQVSMLESFQPGYDRAKTCEILGNRGVSGALVLAPDEDALITSMNWGELRVFTVGATPAGYELPAVMPDYFGAMARVFRQAREAGYRNPGVALRTNSSPAARLRWEAACLALRASFGFASSHATVCFPADAPPDGLRGWLEKNNHDALVSDMDIPADRVPAPFISLDLPAGCRGPGLDLGHEHLGGKAMHLLASEIIEHRGRDSGPAHTTLLPAWREAGKDAGEPVHMANAYPKESYMLFPQAKAS